MSDFPAMIDLTGLSSPTGFIIRGDEALDLLGREVASAGDVNGDGFADLIVGAHYGDDGGESAGEAYVIFGKAETFTTIDLTNLGDAGFVIQGDAEGDNAGRSVASAGDINGDGFDELIVGAPFGDNGGGDAGEAYVIFGKASGFGPLDLSVLGTAEGFVIQGDAEGDFAGYSVASAGDVNGDGYDDMIVGAKFGDDGGENAGEAYVIFGKAAGFVNIDLAGLAAPDGFVIQGAAAGDLTGFSVSTAGDVNGDGYDDLFVGADSNGEGGAEAGAAFVIFGKAEAFTTIDLAVLGTAEGFRILGDVEGDRAGFSVASAGDVNGDGLGDMIVGAPNGDDGGTDAGEAYVIFGRATGLETIDLTNLPADDGFIIRGDVAEDGTGFQVAGAGDVNGDGFDDIIVGAPYNDSGGMQAGRAYVLFGKANGFGTIDLTVLDVEDGFIIQGDAALDAAGASVASAGDVDGDGFGDLIIGAPVGDDGGINAGEAYVIFGRAPTSAATRVGSVAGQTIRGGDFGDDLSGLGGLDRLFGGGGGDILDGGTGNDRLFGEGGIDTARYADAGAGVTLRLVLTTAQNTFGAGSDTLSSIENAIGSAFADSLAGTAGANRLEGGGGGDTLGGQGGEDVLIGGAGDDVLRGGGGDDEMRGGTGDDIYFVNDADDRAIEGVGQGHDQVKAFVDHVLAANIEELRLFGAAQVGTGNDLDNAIFGSSIANTLSGLGGDDTLRGQSGVDELRGGDDADILYGALGNDRLFGDAGEDRMNGEDGVDFLSGGSGEDRLFGGGGADALHGGTGADALNGGIQRDTMTGNSGADQFVFADGDTAATRNGADIVADFSQADGDRINLRQIDANANAGGDQNFAFVGDAAFSGTVGELRYAEAQGNTYVEGDTDGDGNADFMIRLDGLVEPVAGDFVL